MIILVGSVIVFIGFRGLVRDNPDAPPLRDVDYAQVVAPAAAETGWPVAAPAALPAGWTASSVRFQPPPGASWHLGILTGQRQGEQEYVGIEQSVSTVAKMVEAYVGEDAERAGSVQLPRPAADAAGSTQTQADWRRWTSPGSGDIAVTTMIGDQVLLVVTSGEEPLLRSAVSLLSLQS